MTPGAGVLVLRCGHIPVIHIVKIHHFFKGFSYCPILSKMSNLIRSFPCCPYTKPLKYKAELILAFLFRSEMREIFAFVTPSVIFHLLFSFLTSDLFFIFWDFLFYFRAQIRQTEYIEMMSMGGCIKVENFMTSGQWFVDWPHKCLISLKLFFVTSYLRSDKLISTCIQ